MNRRMPLLLAAMLMPSSACTANPDHRRLDAGLSVGESRFTPKDILQTVASLSEALTASHAAPTERPIAALLKDMNGYFAPMVIGANRAMAEIGCPGEVQAPMNMQMKVEDQNRQINAYATDRLYRGLVLNPYTTEVASTTALNNFALSSGPVVTIDTDSAGTMRSFYVGTANAQAGAAAAAAMRAVLSAGDAVAVFGNNEPAWLSGLERAVGAEQEAVRLGLTLTARVPVVWDEPTDYAFLRAALRDTTRNLKGLICVHSNSYLCAEAVAAENLQGVVRVVAFDLEERTKTQMANGELSAIVVQRQFLMGYLGVYAAYATGALGKDKTAALLQPLMLRDSEVNTGWDVITPDAFEEYMTYLDSLGMNQS